MKETNTNTMRLNRIPAITWYWLDMNEAKAEDISVKEGGEIRFELPEEAQSGSEDSDALQDIKGGAGKEFDELINTLRTDEAYGPLLHSRRSLARYGFAHPESAFTSDFFTDYGFRADTKDYSYFLRVNGRIDDYNVYCYCHYRPWLERHMEKARSGIRFITPAYEDLFRIPDGGKIRITWKGGDTRDLVCRYVDDYHFETSSGNLYHICEFAERAALHSSRVEPRSPVIPENILKPKTHDRGNDR